jgi:hypothetical protein
MPSRAQLNTLPPQNGQRYHLFTDFPSRVQQRGVIVPQLVYNAPTTFNQLPSITFCDNKVPGISIAKAARQHTSQLAQGSEQPRLSDTAKKVTIRINVCIADHPLNLTGTYRRTHSSGLDMSRGIMLFTFTTIHQALSQSMLQSSHMKWPRLSSNLERSALQSKRLLSPNITEFYI